MANEIEMKAADTEEMVGCPRCGKPMPMERLVLGLDKCKDCSPKGRPKGIMIYSHKTGGTLSVIEDEETFKKIKGAADDSVESL